MRIGRGDEAAGRRTDRRPARIIKRAGRQRYIELSPFEFLDRLADLIRR
jgi:hypothetical protein